VSGGRFDQRCWRQGGLQSGREGTWSGSEADSSGESGGSNERIGATRRKVQGEESVAMSPAEM
jgi:hypothetical protein